MKKILISIACVGIVLYFVIVYLSVDIEIDDLQDEYHIGDTIDFTVNVSGIGTAFYSYSIMFEKDGGNTTVMGVHNIGPGPSYLDPPFYFSDTIYFSRQIETDVKPDDYMMKFSVMGHTVQKIVRILK